MRRSRFPVLSVVAALVVVGSARAALGACADKPNIILIVADDLGPIELPFLNPPLRFANDDPAGASQLQHEQRLADPARNRLSARVRANPTATTTAGTFSSTNGVCTGPGQPYRCCTGRATGTCAGNVVPLDKIGASHSYSVGSQYGGCTDENVDPTANPGTPGSCNAATDILRGFGGLRRIADQGLIFDRFYANSSLCAPDRATIMTGRYTLRTGVRGNNDPMPWPELSIAEYLKQGCGGPQPQCWGKNGATMACQCFDDGGCSNAPCYTTGLVGKWHLGGHQGQRPWQQGFDEFVGFEGKYRKYFSTSPPTCSPVHPSLRFCNGSNRPCTTDAECSPSTCAPAGARENGRYLYVGATPGASSACDDAEPTGNECCGGNPDLSEPATLAIGHLPKDVVRANNEVDYKCSPDDPGGAGCRYYTRILRDQAVNFIKRHSAHTKPYFLVVTFTAPHGPTEAPVRTAAHYGTAAEVPKHPFDAKKHWAVIEELDAAIGRIVKAIEEEAASDPTTRTLVLFTSDHGRPGDGWGNPALRGGKNTVYEQGIRVGLLGAWFRGGQCTGSAPSWGSSEMMASQVDVFATIADAAGFPIEDLPDSSVKVCAKSALPCLGGTCPLGTGPCLTNRLDGVSMMGAFTNDAHDPRQYVFAEIFKDKKAVVRRPSGGALGGIEGVCGYDSRSPNETTSAFNEGQPHAARQVRGTSKQTCSNDGECTGHTCTLLGKVCDPNGGDPRFSTRCKSNADCPGSTCVAATLPCNECLIPRWKFRGKGDHTTFQDGDALFELASNPEEDERFNLVSDTNFQNVVTPLRQRLYDWHQCTKNNNPGNAADCDD